MNSTLHPPATAIIRKPGDEKFLPTFGGQLDFFLTGAQTNGWLSAGLYVAPPHHGPPLHIHHREDELLIVIEGRFSFFTDGKWTEGGPGTTVFLPRGQAHSFRNIGDAPGKLYLMANPSGLESFFEQCSEPFHRKDGPDMETIFRIGADHGIEFVQS